MARGRPPNPDAINYLRGDPGKRRRYSLTPQGPEGLPIAPEYLCDVARAEWEAIIPLLADMGVLSKIDGTALVCYCEAWARYRQAADHIAQHGPLTEGGKYSPLNRVVSENQSLCKSYLIEFGMTPAARARMKVQPETKPAKSKWDNVLRIAS